MNRKAVMIGIAGLVLAGSFTPASAQVTDAVRSDCRNKAVRVLPALRAPEVEAYIANCLADATATQGTKRKKKKY
jgi:hypothetical protein